MKTRWHRKREGEEVEAQRHELASRATEEEGVSKERKESCQRQDFKQKGAAEHVMVSKHSRSDVQEPSMRSG
ncbi:hypothetical protein BC567DRAFT_70751 [Phyllosticta citribraziliensis]